MTKWAVLSVVCGAMCLVFGGMLVYGAIANPGDGAFAVMLILGLLGAAGGICGIAGGLSINKNKVAARKMLLAAAVLLLPYAFVFFFLLMVARNKAAGAEDVWGEEKEEA